MRNYELERVTGVETWPSPQQTKDKLPIAEFARIRPAPSEFLKI